MNLPGDVLSHNRRRRGIRHSRTALVEFSLRHRVELPVHLRELGFSLSIRILREQRRVEIISHSEQTHPLSVEGVAVHVLRLIWRGA
jgi:hypothetical protein